MGLREVPFLSIYVFRISRDHKGRAIVWMLCFLMSVGARRGVCVRGGTIDLHSEVEDL